MVTRYKDGKSHCNHDVAKSTPEERTRRVLVMVTHYRDDKSQSNDKVMKSILEER